MANQEVYCYVVNQTGQALNYDTDDIKHGEFKNGGDYPISTIEAGSSQQKVFKIKSPDGSLDGCSGNVKYALPDGSKLVFMFYNPIDSSDPGNPENDWFYAVINDIPADLGAVNYYVDIDVQICDSDGHDCSGMSAKNPPDGDQMTATVTIHSTAPAAGAAVRPKAKPRPEKQAVSTDHAELIIHLTNATQQGYVTLNGLTNGDDPQVLDSGNPPICVPAVASGETQMILDARGQDQNDNDGESKVTGSLTWNVPNGSNFEVKFNIDPFSKSDSYVQFKNLDTSYMLTGDDNPTIHDNTYTYNLTLLPNS